MFFLLGGSALSYRRHISSDEENVVINVRQMAKSQGLHADKSSQLCRPTPLSILFSFIEAFPHGSDNNSASPACWQSRRYWFAPSTQDFGASQESSASIPSGSKV
ncbi:hypothetical protein, partial [Herbaspirillum sp. UBA812]|uniref:hypothetical protein n=1 Tax=Herbaspirillum sp. UBA812 TaxID=1946590 RepID=UPI00257DEF84